MVDDVADCIGVQILWGHFDEFGLWLASHLSLKLKVVVVVFKGDPRFRHWIRQLFLVVKPPTIISE